jgi:hypothetical protein
MGRLSCLGEQVASFASLCRLLLRRLRLLLLLVAALIGRCCCAAAVAGYGLLLRSLCLFLGE